MDRFLKHEEVIEITGLSPVSIWRLEGRGEFPKRRKISPNRVGWLASEIEEWIHTRPVVEGVDRG